MRVHIDDNWHVNQGDLLVELDLRDIEARPSDDLKRTPMPRGAPGDRLLV